eukprot:6192484-Pleurochrysis_carterae.AAC.1
MRSGCLETHRTIMPYWSFSSSRKERSDDGATMHAGHGEGGNVTRSEHASRPSPDMGNARTST